MSQLSLIIPSYRRVKHLLRALESVQKQIYHDFEILVVDNAADEDVEREVTKFNQTARVSARYLAEPRLGLLHARHAGVCAARGDILIFTDDDATFDPSWLQAYAKAFTEHPDMAAAGGPVRPIWEVSPPEWLLKFIGDAKIFGVLSLIDLYDEFRLGPKYLFFGVNMAIRRDVLFKVGGFNPESFGDIWLGNGETGLNHKLWDRKMLIGYIPEAVVYHHIPPQRMTAKYFCHRMSNEGACAEYAKFHERIPGPVGLLLRIFRIGLSFMNSALMILARALVKRKGFIFLKTRMSLAYALSRIRYVLRLFHDRQFRELVTKKDWLKADYC